MMKRHWVERALFVIFLIILGGYIYFDLKNSDRNNYAAPARSTADSKGLGEGGEPVKFDLKNLSFEERAEYEASSVNISLNVFVSDRISVRRYLPDRRDDFCKEKTFDNLPDTSVIITFHNELYSLLLRTLHSVVDRSPPELIKEIILVDDGSDYDYINGKLQKYLETNFDKVKLIHTKSQLGLIKARLAGIEIATGETLTFLDSHVECLTGWLEPLLDEVKRDKRRIVEPSLPNISSKDFSIEQLPFPLVGCFNWMLTFGWLQAINEVKANGGNKNLPFINSAMVGGVFSINREFFKSLGYWDDGFEMYGFENMELTFKAWMCHGSVYKVPCSVVAHVFHNRKVGDWKGNWESIKRNRDRVAEVWMDEYKDFVYQWTGPKADDLGEINHLLELRAKNKCHNFEWFMKNVVPDYIDPKQSVHRDVIRNPVTNLCIIVGPLNSLIGYPCTKPHRIEAAFVTSSSIWDMTKEGNICTNNSCVVILQTNLFVYYKPWIDATEVFTYDEAEKMFLFRRLNQCLEINDSKITLNACNTTLVNQKWAWGFE